jgi:hypothetical protein
MESTRGLSPRGWLSVLTIIVVSVLLGFACIGFYVFRQIDNRSVRPVPTAMPRPSATPTPELGDLVATAISICENETPCFGRSSDAPVVPVAAVLALEKMDVPRGSMISTTPWQVSWRLTPSDRAPEPGKGVTHIICIRGTLDFEGYYFPEDNPNLRLPSVPGGPQSRPTESTGRGYSVEWAVRVASLSPYQMLLCNLLHGEPPPRIQPHTGDVAGPEPIQAYWEWWQKTNPSLGP